MFKMIYHPEELDRKSEDIIAEASSRLDVGEFQLFQLGYVHWFGRETSPDAIEALFLAYLLENEMPPWARQYARHVLELDDAGGLDSTDPAYHRFDRPYPPVSRRMAWGVSLGTLAAVVFYLAMVMLTSDDTQTLNCLFPPCP